MIEGLHQKRDRSAALAAYARALSAHARRIRPSRQPRRPCDENRAGASACLGQRHMPKFSTTNPSVSRGCVISGPSTSSIPPGRFRGLRKDYGEVGPAQLRETGRTQRHLPRRIRGISPKRESNGDDRDFAPPVDYDMVYEDGQLTLTFTLPLSEPVRPAYLVFLRDGYLRPHFFFGLLSPLNEGDEAVRLVGGPSVRCQDQSPDRVPQKSRQRQICRRLSSKPLWRHPNSASNSPTAR